MTLNRMTGCWWLLPAVLASGLAGQSNGKPPAREVGATPPAATAVTRFFADVRAGRDGAALASGREVLRHGRAAVSELLDGLNDRTPREMAWGLRALGNLGDAAAVPVVARLCGHASPQVRADAVAAAGRLLGDDARGLLIQAVGDADVGVRRRAFDAVVRLSPRLLPRTRRPRKTTTTIAHRTSK